MGSKIVWGLTAFMLAACVILWVTKPESTAASFEAPEPEPQETLSSPAPAVVGPAGETQPSASEEPTQSAEQKAPAAERCVFGEPLTESERVEDTFFDSAVFLGDSRTEGLQLFSGLAHGDFYWLRGMTVFRVDDEKYAKFEVNGEKLTLLGALRAKKYDSVYIMLGVNELGYSVSSYASGLSALLDAVIAAQPEAVIYLQTLPPVNDAAAKKSGLASYECNANVTKFNEVIVRLAREKHVVLLDTASAYRGADGQLPESLTSDGVHFTVGGYKLWADYLRCHTVEPEVYFGSRKELEQ